MRQDNKRQLPALTAMPRPKAHQRFCCGFATAAVTPAPASSFGRMPPIRTHARTRARAMPSAISQPALPVLAAFKCFHIAMHTMQQKPFDSLKRSKLLMACTCCCSFWAMLGGKMCWLHGHLCLSVHRDSHKSCPRPPAYSMRWCCLAGLGCGREPGPPVCFLLLAGPAPEFLPALAAPLVAPAWPAHASLPASVRCAYGGTPTRMPREQ